jgi:hypothetical protein
MIYNMVFQYPRAGLEFSPKQNTSKNFRVATDDVAQLYSQEMWERRPAGRRVFRPMISSCKALSLLLVNKQVFSESFPYFYRNNLFYFEHSDLGRECFRRVPSYRLQHITQLPVHLNEVDARLWNQVFSYITALPNLRKLYLHIEENEREYPYPRIVQGQIDIPEDTRIGETTKCLGNG